MGHLGLHLVQSYQERAFEETQPYRAYFLSFNLNSFAFLSICSFQRVWKTNKRNNTLWQTLTLVYNVSYTGDEARETLLFFKWCSFAPKTLSNAKFIPMHTEVGPVRASNHSNGGYTWSWRLSPAGLAEDSSQTARLRVSFPFPAPDWEGERRGVEEKIKKTHTEHSQTAKSSPPSHDHRKPDLGS